MIAQIQATKPAAARTYTRLLQRCTATQECDDCRNQRPGLQRRKGDRNEPTSVPPIVHEVLRSPGQPLNASTRAFMETRLGHDFSRVRIHSDAQAAESARAVNALAYTVGREVVFGSGQFQPHGHAGKQLLAHELTHVVQQGQGSIPMELKVDHPESGLEMEAAAVSREITADFHSNPPATATQYGDHSDSVGSTPLLVQRSPDDKGGGTGQGAATSPYPEEQEVLLYAAKAMDENKLAQGTVFYAAKYWKATGVSSNAFAVGPFSSDMGQYFYVYRSKSSADKANARTFTRGTYLGGWRGGKITPEVQKELAGVTGTKEVQVQTPGAAFREPRDSLTFMMVVWKARGLLDPARLPQGVDPFPPILVTEEEEKRLRANLSSPAAASLIGGITLATSGRAAAQSAIGSTGAQLTATTLARGTGTFEAVAEPAATTAIEEETGAVVGRAIATRAAGAVAAGLAAGATVLLYESPNPVSNYDTGMSEVTGGPFGTPGEYDWENRLTPRQRRYIRDLWNQRYTTPAPVPIQAPAPQPTQTTQPVPKQTKTTDPVPTPTTQTEPEQERRRRRRRCNAPTGLTPDDPIPISWFKPKVDDWYPPQIELQGHSYSRDVEDHLPHGEPIGVSARFWPTLGKIVQLAPDCGVPRSSRICPNAGRFRDVLTGYGFQWGGRRYLQADHVQDVQWAAPDGTHMDDFRNLWPLDSAANNSAGATQNVHQPVSFCETPRGPLIEMRIGEVMRLARAGRPYYGRYFVIVNIARGPEAAE